MVVHRLSSLAKDVVQAPADVIEPNDVIRHPDDPGPGSLDARAGQGEDGRSRGCGRQRRAGAALERAVSLSREASRRGRVTRSGHAREAVRTKSVRPIRWRSGRVAARRARQMACPGPPGLDGLLCCADEWLSDLSISASASAAFAAAPT